MFERFTDRSRRVLVLAQDEARGLRHNFIGTEHILLGLLRESDGVGARALTELGISLEGCRQKVIETIGPASDDVVGAPPFTPRTKKVLELALREALSMGHNYIGTEHLLLALVREGEGVAAQVLITQGASLPAVRGKVFALLAGTGTAPRTTTAGGRVEQAARTRAGSEAVASQHYLLGLLDDTKSLASKVLASFGVTAEAVQMRLDELSPQDTDDVPPQPYEATADQGMVTIRIKDPAMAEKIQRGELVVQFLPPDPELPAEPQEDTGT